MSNKGKKEFFIPILDVGVKSRDFICKYLIFNYIHT